MSEQVSHMGDGSEQAGGSGEHRKGSVCGDGAESQEVFMERGGVRVWDKSLCVTDSQT